MRYTMTLVAGEGRLESGKADSVTDRLRDLGARLGDPDWLAADTACDLTFEGIAAELAETVAREVLAGLPVDLAVQPASGRRKALLVADMESTIIANEMLDELADLAGIGPRVAQITERAMRGELDFEAAVKERTGLLVGKPESLLEEALGRVRHHPGAATLAATLASHGVPAYLVTGGFGWFARRVAAELGFRGAYSNEIELVDGRLSGRVLEPVLDGSAKLVTLRRLAAELGIGLEAAAAVGDGANDLEMIGAAGLGVAFRAKPAVAATADFRIDHVGLEALLYFQGYRGAELVRSSP